MASVDPRNAGWRRALAFSYDKLGDLARGKGDLPAAEKWGEESLAIKRRLASADPENAHWQRDLARGHEMLGAVAEAAGDLVHARERFGAGSRSGIAWRAPIPATICGDRAWTGAGSASIGSLPLSPIAVSTRSLVEIDSLSPSP